MSQEMPIFVSLIVWLFFIRGADGELTVKPDNFVIVKGTTATLRCETDQDVPLKWTYQHYGDPNKDDDQEATDDSCKPLTDFVSTSQPSPKACYLLVNDTAASTTYMYKCKQDTTIARAIVIVLESPLKCGMEDDKYSCTMANSAYLNESAITAKPYISSRLVWKDDKGNLTETKMSDFNSSETVVTTDIPFENLNPYVCSADFEMVNMEDQTTEYSKLINILPDGILECKYPVVAEQNGTEQVTEGQAEAAAAKQAGDDGNKTSNANLERDGVDAIAMMLSLMAAFLVY